MLTPRSYLLFFRYFNFVLIVLRQGAKDCYIAKLAPKFELYCIVNHRKFNVNCRICYHSWMVNVQEKVI